MNGIDWSVTARLGEPHVRDRDPQTVRRTRVYIDRRRPMHEGAPGETKLDYAREIGLLLTTQAADNDDPLCVTLVDDRGDSESEHGRVTEASRTTSGAAYYQRVRRTLHDLTPDNDKPTDEEIIEDTTRHFRTTTATRSRSAFGATRCCPPFPCTRSRRYVCANARSVLRGGHVGYRSDER